jgi:hypothetical protein
MYQPSVIQLFRYEGIISVRLGRIVFVSAFHRQSDSEVVYPLECRFTVDGRCVSQSRVWV